MTPQRSLDHYCYLGFIKIVVVVKVVGICFPDLFHLQVSFLSCELAGKEQGTLTEGENITTTSRVWVPG